MCQFKNISRNYDGPEIVKSRETDIQNGFLYREGANDVAVKSKGWTFVLVYNRYFERVR